MAVTPSPDRCDLAKGTAPDWLPDEAKARPARWAPEWRETLVDGIARVAASQPLPGAWVPALSVPRSVHGQSQGICDLFGARVERQGDGNYFVHPLPAEPERVDRLEPRPLETSRYWGAVEWLRYARAATRGQFAFRNPVMTGPFDTVNYLLGTTLLMEWVYAHPKVLHRLLGKVTAVIVGMILALKQAAGGALHGDALACVRNAFCLCSECRSLVSEAVYEEFEAPYLAQIGERCGPYAIHSCGAWERTVPSMLRDGRLRAANGQIRENDLARLCRLARGELVLSIGPSQNLHERYTWADRGDFFRHVLQHTPAGQPLEISIAEAEIDCWNELSARKPGIAATLSIQSP